MLFGVAMATLPSQAAFSCVSCVVVPEPSTRNTSGGVVSDDFAYTTNPFDTSNAATAPPCTTSCGIPPAAGTRYRFCVPLFVAEK
jgi:hypothetical protein